MQTIFDLADKVFNPDILQSLLQFKQHIKSIQHKKVKELFYVAWLSIIEDVSNIKKKVMELNIKIARELSMAI